MVSSLTMPVYASNGTWLNTGSVNNWANASNWASGTVPGATSLLTSTDVATFNTAIGTNTFGSSTTPIDVDLNRNIGGITFDTSSVGSYTIGSTTGNALLLTTAGTIQTTSTAANIENIAAPLTLEGNTGSYTFSSNSSTAADVLNFTGGITAGGTSGTTTLTLSGTNTGVNTISGVLGDGSTGAKIALVENTSGTWALSGNNTYTGGTTLTAGTLDVNSTTALGATTSALAINGGTINNTSGAAITNANNNPITLGGSFGFGTSAGTASNDLNLGTGAVTNGGNYTLTLNGADTLTFGGVMTNTLAGINTLTVNNGSGTASATAVNFAGYALSNSSTNYVDVINGSGNVNITGPVTNGGTSSASGLTYSGTGALTLSGVNTYSGGTTLSSGSLNINSTTALGATAGALTISGGTINNTSGAAKTIANANPITLGGNFAFGTSAGTASNDLNLGTGAVTNGGNYTLTLNGADTLTFGGEMTNTQAGINTLTVNNGSGTTSATAVNFAGYALSNSSTNYIDVINGSGNVNILGVVSNGGTSSASGLTYSGTGTLTLSGTNTYAGATTVSSGIVNIQNSSALGSGGATVSSGGTLQLQGGISAANTLSLDGTGYSSNEGALENVSGTNTYTGAITLAGATRINADAGSLTLSSSATVGGSGEDLTVGGSGNTIMNGVIGTGGGSLTKDGAGTLTLGATNTFTGGLTVDNGTLSIATFNGASSDGPLGNNSSVTLGSSSNTTGTLEYTGTTTSSTMPFTLALGGIGAFQIDSGLTDLTLSGLISSTGGLTKTGTGTLTLSDGSNSYSGGTIVNAGTLVVGASGALGSTSGALAVNNPNTGDGTNVEVDLATGAGTTTGTLSGAIATPTSGTNNDTINNEGQLFTVNQKADKTFAGVITGAGGFTLGSSSTNALTLSGDNAYTGGTIVSGGTLKAENPGALGTGTVEVQSGAALSLDTTSLAIGSNSYTQDSGSILDLNIASPSSFGNITASSASTMVSSGSTLNVTFTGEGYIRNNEQFEIVNSGGLSSLVNQPSINNYGSSILRFSTLKSGGNLYLVSSTQGFTPSANNPNARALGTVLDNAPQSISSDMSSVLGKLQSLSSTSQITSALNTMGPIVDRGVVDNSFASMNNFVSATLDRVQDVLDRQEIINNSLNKAEGVINHSGGGFFDETGFSSGDENEASGMWAKPYGSYLNQSTLQGIQGYNAWNAGTVVGYDHLINDNLTLGVSGGYAYGQVNSDINDASTDINSGQGTIYAGYQGEEHPYFIDGAGTFAWNWYDGRRDISIGSLNRTADASYDGQQYGAYLGGGYKFKFDDHWGITPLASLQYTHLAVGSYTETNANSLDLNVSSQSYDTLESGLGASISTVKECDWGLLTPEVHAKWLYDIINDNMTVTSSFTGGGASFTSSGARPAKSGADIGGKLTFDFMNDMSLIGELDAELKDGFVGVYGSGTVRYKF